MVSSSTFPVSAGTVLSLKCDAGYELTGDTEVTCIQNTDFQYSEEPNCGELNRKSQQLFFPIMFMSSIEF